MKVFYTVVVLFILLLSISDSYSKEILADSMPKARGEYFIGVISGYSRIWNSTSLPVLLGSEDCGVFTKGQSSGYFAGITFDYKLIPNFIEASGRLIFSSRPALLTTETSPYQVLNTQNNQYVPLVLQHVYTANLQYILLDIGAKIYPLEDIPFYSRIGFNVGNALVGKDYTQTEEILSPSGVLFPEGVRKHTLFNGSVPGISTAYSGIIGIGANLEMQPNIFIYPEISFQFGIGSIVSTSDWNVNLLNIGVGVRYEFGEEKVKLPPTPAPEPPPPPPPPVIVEIPKPLPPQVVLQSVSTVPLQVQETIVTQTFPLLPYIFFDSASAVVRERYFVTIKDKTTFSESSLPKETLPTYYTMLNLLGKRLTSNPKIKLIITGTTDGKELTTSAQRTVLAKERAQAIANFLTQTWGISNSQIILQTRDIPELPSNQKYKEGNEENRRAELSSEDAFMLSPVVHSRFLEFAPVQNKQIFSVSMLHPENANSWNMEMSYKGTLLKKATGNGAPPTSLPLEITNEETSKIGNDISVKDSLYGQMSITQNDGSVVTAECYFPIIKSRNQFEVSRLSLIVFDFNRSDISDQNKEMMKKFVNEAMKPASVSSITGSTDKLGEIEYNQQLSTARAKSVNEFLLSIKPQANISSVVGLGASSLPYDNNLPEGRYYCRTVSLEVKTPLNK